MIGIVAGCGAATAAPAGVTTSATTPATTHAAPASPSPAPPPPAVMIQQANGSSGSAVLQAMDASGNPLWSVPYGQGLEIFTSGPRIFEFDYMTHNVSVFDRSGHPVGDGTVAANNEGSVVFSPTSAEWAWSSDDGVSPSPLPS